MTQARVTTRNFFESCRNELVISFSHDFRVFSLWVTTQLGRDPKKNSGRDPRSGWGSIIPNTSLSEIKKQAFEKVSHVIITRNKLVEYGLKTRLNAWNTRKKTRKFKNINKASFSII
jgi:hypothetical protein